MKTKNFVAFIVWVTILLAGSPASAGEFASHGYLLASIGEADTDFRPTISDAIQDDDTAFEIGVGFAFNPYFSVEGSYQDFGEPTGFAGCPPEVFCIAIVPLSAEPVEVTGWSVALRGAVPVTDSLSVFARLGFLSWDTSARTAGLNDSGTDLLYGGGIAADFNERFGLQLSYEEADPGIETVKLGVRLRF